MPQRDDFPHHFAICLTFPPVCGHNGRVAVRLSAGSFLLYLAALLIPRPDLRV
jgi:hypothetical protein